MKKIGILLIFLLSIAFVNAQGNDALSVDYLTSQKKKAVASENYDLAAKYEKALRLKSELKQKIAAEDWEGASATKNELNAIKFDNSSSSSSSSNNNNNNNNSSSSVDRSEMFKNVMFVDGLLGFGGNAGGVFSLHGRFGNKWYFTSSDKFRPGFQATWMRLGIRKSFTNSGFSLDFYPVNVGFTSMLAFNDKMGLEMNFNFGPAFQLNSFSPVNMMLQAHVNPEVKFRYNKLTFGIDLSILAGNPFVAGSGGSGIAPSSFGVNYTTTTFNFSVGTTF